MSKVVMGLRLISQEDIIVQVDQADLGKYNSGVGMRLKVTAPALIGMMQGAGGQPSMGLADYLPMAEKKEIAINVAAILYAYELDSGIEAAYRKRFGPAAHLVLPESQGLILPFTKREE